MKMVALVLAILGLLCLIMGALTAFGIIPTMLEAMPPLGELATSTFAWFGVSLLVLLASLAFGAVGRDEG